MVVLYVDGGCSGNGQTDMSKRRMVSLVTDDTGDVLRDESREGGSNNIAELIAVHLALNWCESNGIREVTVLTDSMNNLAWVNGRKVGKHLNDRERVLRIRDGIAHLRERINLTLEWVPREQNKAGHVIERRYGL
jgi:ribonuclease HI